MPIIPYTEERGLDGETVRASTGRRGWAGLGPRVFHRPAATMIAVPGGVKRSERASECPSGATIASLRYGKVGFCDRSRPTCTRALTFRNVSDGLQPTVWSAAPGVSPQSETRPIVSVFRRILALFAYARHELPKALRAAGCLQFVSTMLRARSWARILRQLSTRKSPRTGPKMRVLSIESRTYGTIVGWVGTYAPRQANWVSPLHIE